MFFLRAENFFFACRELFIYVQKNFFLRAENFLSARRNS